ncbi:NAD-dependent epimerase/dehydratase family protein [Candidatus Kaiserbacteria bacterium]|nr:NAD-dependent epimerase/dehydratase family protein [Candidatus Kaiserbacteria bacterium]
MSDFYSGKKVVVTGGAGFIGSHAVEMLVERGAQVTVPIRSGTKTDFLEGVRGRVSFVEADLRSRESVDALLKGQEIVMNLAAAKGGGIAHSMKHHGSLFRDNMQPFLQVLDSAREAGVERFLVVSSACVYSRDVTNPTPESEGFLGNPEPANAGYGWSKRMEEYLGQAYAEEFGMKIAIARPYNAYGPRDDFFAEYSHVIPGLIKRIFAGENPLVVWGSGKQTRSFLYVTDFARGLLEVCEKYAVADPLNIGGDEEVSIGELARLLIELSGKHTELQFDTSKPDGQPRRTCDTTKALEKIGYRAGVPLREGLKRSIEWYQAHV